MGAYSNEYGILYEIQCGIKQGSPMSPMLFLSYIDDIFDYFLSTFGTLCIFETIHVMMHVDDFNINSFFKTTGDYQIETLDILLQ